VETSYRDRQHKETETLESKIYAPAAATQSSFDAPHSHLIRMEMPHSVVKFWIGNASGIMEQEMSLTDFDKRKQL